MQKLIDRAHVHKESPDAVLLGSASKVEEGHWRFDVMLPEGVAAPSPNHGWTTILAAELTRQTAIAYAHLAGDVPMDSAFLLHELSFIWCQDAFELGVDGGAEPYMDVHLHAARMRRNQLSDLQLTGTLMSGNAVLGVAFGDLSCIAPQTYKAIRRNAAPVVQSNTGGLGTDLVKVARDGQHLRAEVAWNWGDPFVFDHFSDHVPGMLLGRAALRAHEILTGEAPTAIDLRCGRFAEFNAPVDLEAESSSDGSTTVTVTQAGEHVATVICSHDETRTLETAGIRFQRDLA